MITREPGTGREPIPSISLGTWASHWSSWRVKVLRLSEYHEPAWEGSLDCIMSAFPFFIFTILAYILEAVWLTSSVMVEQVGEASSMEGGEVGHRHSGDWQHKVLEAKSVG